MAKGTDMDTLGQQLIAMEQKDPFQWFGLKDSDWSHDDPMFDMFMNQLVAFSFVTQKPIQGDQLQARNNKRKMKRCAKLIRLIKKGEWLLASGMRKRNSARRFSISSAPSTVLSLKLWNH